MINTDLLKSLLGYRSPQAGTEAQEQAQEQAQDPKEEIERAIRKERHQTNSPKEKLEEMISELLKQLEQNQKELEKTKVQLVLSDSIFSDIRDLQKQLEKEKEDHEKTKAKLQFSRSKCSHFKAYIWDLEEKLYEEMEDHERAKIQIRAKNNEVEWFKDITKLFIARYHESNETIRQNQYIVDDLKADIVEKEYLCQKDIKKIKAKLEEVTQELEILERENNKEVQRELLEEIKKMRVENRELQLKLDESAEQFEHYYLENAGLRRIVESRLESEYLKHEYDELKKMAEYRAVDSEEFVECKEKLNKIYEEETQCEKLVCQCEEVEKKKLVKQQNEDSWELKNLQKLKDVSAKFSQKTLQKQIENDDAENFWGFKNYRKSMAHSDQDSQIANEDFMTDLAYQYNELKKIASLLLRPLPILVFFGLSWAVLVGMKSFSITKF